ncbi:MAG: sulfite exporter TauE/SafE family protein, partial [Patescibacteria group bacterium]
MEINPVIYLILAFSTFLNILVPFSGSTTITPLLSIWVEPHRVIALFSFLVLLGGIIRIYLFRKEIQFKYVRKFLPISILGATLGSLSLIQINSRFLLFIILLFTLYFLYKTIKHYFKERIDKPQYRFATSVTGLLSGFLQGTGLSGSDLRNNFLYSEGLTLPQVHGTTAVVGSANFLIATLVRLYTKQISIPDLMPLLYLFPVIL